MTWIQKRFFSEGWDPNSHLCISGGGGGGRLLVGGSRDSLVEAAAVVKHRRGSRQPRFLRRVGYFRRVEHLKEGRKFEKVRLI